MRVPHWLRCRFQGRRSPLKMDIVKGHFNLTHGSPCVRLILRNPFDEAKHGHIEAVIDTGFSGFVQVPLGISMQLGLEIEATITPVKLANDSIDFQNNARIQVSTGNDYVSGMANISSQGSAVLLGMEFLRVDERLLLVNNEFVILAKTKSVQGVLPDG